MSSPLVAVTDHVFPNLDPTEAVLAGIGAEMRLAADKSAESILAVARDADGVIVCYASVDAAIIDELERCKVIARTGIGFDNVDVAAAAARGIVVTNVPEYCEDEVSDHAMALLLSLVRKVAPMNRLVESGTWDAGAAKPIRRLRGRTLGLVGFGKIPRLVARKAQAFGIIVQAHDPFVPQEVAAGAGVELVSLDDLLASSDYVSVHAPLTDQTRNMIDAAAIGKMKPGALLVNTARGPLVDIDAVADALESGHLGGAGLDVLPEEPPSPSMRLAGRPDVLLTPHIAFYSEESMVDLQAKAAEQVALVLSGKEPQYPVNADLM